MKTLATYYSYSGITEKVIAIVKEVLEKKSELKIQRLRPKEEITSFLAQCMAARFKKRSEIEEALFDASGFSTLQSGPEYFCTRLLPGPQPIKPTRSRKFQMKSR